MGGVEEEDEMSPSTERRFLGAVLTVEWLDGWTMVGGWVRRGHHLRDHYCATSLSYCMDKYIYPIRRIAMSVCLLHWLSLAS